MITEKEIERVYNCNVGKKCRDCKVGFYKGLKISIMSFIICDNCGNRPKKINN